MQRDMRHWAITETVKDTFNENMELRKAKTFLGLALAMSIVTNVVFALKFIFG